MKSNGKFFPNIRDPRWLQALILLSYAIVAREMFNFERPHYITLSIVVFAMLIDTFIGFFKYKVIRFPLGAIIVALACSLLIDSTHFLIYLFAVALGVLSKAFINFENRHIFNPANFSVVIILYAGSGYATSIQNLFAGYLTPSLAFLTLGIINVIYSRQHLVSLSFFIGFLIFAAFRWLSGTYWLLAFGPCLGPGFLLFTFHMISDPATTPHARGPQVIFGLLAALIDAVLRHHMIPHGTFLALFLLNSLMPVIRGLENLKNFNKIIRPGYLKYGMKRKIHEITN